MDLERRNPTVKGPAEWFTGEVWIDTITHAHGDRPTMIGAVHFTAGARTAWHRHSIGQTLYVTDAEYRREAE